MTAKFNPYFSQHFTVLLVVFTTFIDVSQTLDKRQENDRLSNFISGLLQIDKLFQDCTLQIFSYDYQTSEAKWIDELTSLTANSHLNLQINGLTISAIKPAAVNTSDSNKNQYQQPKTIQHSRRCSVVIMVINTKLFSSSEEHGLQSASVFPLFTPPTIRNRDKYLLLTEDRLLESLYNSKFIKGLKFKLVLELKPPVNCDASKMSCSDFKISVKRFCQYGLCTNASYIETVNLTVSDIFPDHEKNYFGYTLRLSTTTKVPQLLELGIKDDNGEKVYIAKRGLYATVLKELSSKLNFTYEIVPSSGGGSTGHILPNGTVVGIVGDTYRGIVDFGFMAAITFQRFPYAEFCAPINFAYLGFATGPPKKSYTWKAIVWPFNLSMWFCVILTVIISAKFLSFTWNTDYRIVIPGSTDEAMRSRMRMSYIGGIAFAVRGLLEQCAELRSGIRLPFKSFLICWLLFSLVCSTLYRSKMVSLLTFPVYGRVPKSFDELATKKDFAIDFHYFGNVGYAYFKSSTNPSFVEIFQRMGKEPSPLKCLQRTLTDKSACIIFIVTFDELLHRNLSDQYGQSPLKFTPHNGAFFPAGVIHEYKAPLSFNFQSILFPAMETGLIPLWQQEDLNKILEDKNRWQKANKVDVNALWGEERSDDDALRVRNLQGAFLIIVVGLASSIIAFFMELFNRCRLGLFACFHQKSVRKLPLRM
ncbi:unnamed protein product [Orchesella dallaii]|uniref:Ionotropic glutamate receptor C-terminal domain-containing protein n=1 Tax=Orchesella dallaii TaxID=48710 RepID=A0ABP1S365_9HEXA